MSTIAVSPTTHYYRANVISAGIEPSDLVAEISKQTSSSESDRSTQHKYWAASPILRESESFLAFLNEILSFNSEDDQDQISDNALKVALFTTERAYVLTPHRWRKPRIATDGGGGVRLTWKAGEKEIRAVFPAEMRRPQYLYVEEGNTHSAINNFTSLTLLDKLNWLVSTNR